MERDELKTALKAGEGKQPEIKDVINGKAFMAELDKCKTPDEIYGLLAQSMDSKKLADRVGLLSKNCHDKDLIVSLESNKARINADFGFRTSHEALVIMAADRFIKITEGKPDHKVLDFKKGLAEYMVKHKAPEKDASIELAKQMLAWRQR